MGYLFASITTTLASITTLATLERIHITNSTVGSIRNRSSNPIYTIDATTDNIACRIRTLTHHTLCPLEERAYRSH